MTARGTILCVRGRSGRPPGGVAAGTGARVSVGRQQRKPEVVVVGRRQPVERRLCICPRAQDLDGCALAAMNGHLELLQWAPENGCAWNQTNDV